MSDATFETFLVSGLLVLIAAVAYLAWSAWRWVDRERDMEKLALTGVGYELNHNLRRMMRELAGVADGTLTNQIEVVPVVHPQLDALLSRPNEADRFGLTVMRGHYNELGAHKLSLKAALAEKTDIGAPANVAVDAVIESLATLYLWEEHDGRSPQTARSTRSWDVRDWMKAHKFHADTLPGLHLRDQVVERLRQNGMVLTPKPLTYTASEYFAKQYDRKADPNAPFWKRKKKLIPVVDATPEVEHVADASVTAPEPDPEITPEAATPATEEPVAIEPSAITAEAAPDDPAPLQEPEPEPEPELESKPEPVLTAEPTPMAETEPEQIVTIEPETVEPARESGPEAKPQTPGTTV